MVSSSSSSTFGNYPNFNTDSFASNESILDQSMHAESELEKAVTPETVSGKVVEQEPQEESKPWNFFEWLLTTLGFIKKEDPASALTTEQKEKIRLLIQELVRLKKDLATCIEVEEDRGAMSLEMLYKFHLKRGLEVRDKAAKTYQESIHITQRQVDYHRAEQEKEWEKQIKAAKDGAFWQTLTGLGMSVQAALFAMTLPFGLNIAAIVVIAVLGIDRIAGNPIEASLADWLSKGDNESKESWFQRFKFIADIGTVALGIPGAAKGGFNLALGLFQLGAVTGDGYTQSKKTLSEGQMERLKFVLDLLSEKQNTIIENLTDLHEKETDHVDQIAKMIKHNQQTKMLIAQRV